MATNKGKMTMRSEFSRYVPAPFVFRKKYNKPSEECCREYSLMKKELNSLFEGFSAHPEDVARRRRVVAAEKKALEIKRKEQFKACSSTSFAAIAAKGAIPSPQAISEEPKILLMSTRAAKRDVEIYASQVREQRAAALALVKAMAARHPRRVQKAERKFVELVSPSELKEARRNLRRERKFNLKPKEVDSFDFRCYYEQPSIEKYSFVRKPAKVVKTQGRVGPTSERTIKKRSIIREKPHCNLFKPQFYIEETRDRRRSLLFSQLSRTGLGRALLVGYLRKLAHRQHLDFEPITPQMDPEGAVVKAEAEESQASNTVLTSNQIVEKGCSQPPDIGFRDYAVSNEIQEYQTLYDRWLYVDTFKWSVSHTRIGQVLYSFNGIGDLFPRATNSQNIQMFLNHRFYRSDAHVRFVMNSQFFQIGCVVVDNLYIQGANTFKQLDNIYSALQRNHAFMSAGSSNDAELTIPYLYNKSLILTKGEAWFKVSCRVLNPLVVSGQVSTECSISVFVRFSNAKFYGLIQRNLGYTEVDEEDLEEIDPQMERIADLMNAGSGLIRAISGSPNQDYPPLPLRPISLIPQGVPSLSYTDKAVLPINVLRAESVGQTPFSLACSEVKPEEVCKIWGFIQTKLWESRNPTDSKLFSCKVRPVLAWREYDGNLDERSSVLEVKVITPLANVSQHYGYWRGDIEFKFQIICGKWTSGRLIVGYVPYWLSNSISLSTLRESAFKIFDLHDSNEFVFSCPWNWINSFCRIQRLNSDDIISPGTLFVKVLNPLVTVENVPPKAYINIYMRAGQNFELSVPRPPFMDIDFAQQIFPPSTSYLAPYDRPNYAYTSWRAYLPYGQDYLVTINTAAGANGWTGFKGLNDYEVYELASTTTKGKVIRIPFYLSNSHLSYVRYGIYHPSLATQNSHGLVVFPEEGRMEALRSSNYLKGLKRPAKPEDYFNGQFFAFTWVKDGEWSQVQINGKWVTASDPDDPIRFFRIPNDIQPQMDNAPEVVSILNEMSPSTSCGLKVFGETCPDLKSIMRRFNYLGSLQLNSCKALFPRDCPYAAKIRVSPMRTLFPDSSSSYDNRVRHGTIPNLCSMFRGWRSGMRYVFTVIGQAPAGSMIFVQHRFDEHDNTDLSLAYGPPKIRNRLDFMSTQYATYCQALSVNTTFTVEVPYYQEYEFSSTIPIDSSSHNGFLYVWYHSPGSVAPIQLEVLYSVADDFSWFGFQGCPGFIDTTEIAIEPQMDTEPVVEPQGLIESTKKALGIKTVEDNVQLAASSVQEASVNIKETSSKLSKLIDSLKSGYNKFIDSSAAFTQKLKDKVKTKCIESGISSVWDYIYSTVGETFRYLTHLVYAIIQPTVAIVTWAIVNLFVELFNFSMKGYKTIYNFVKKMWSKMSSTQQPQSEEIRPQGEDPDMGSYASLVYLGLASLCSLKSCPPVDWESCSTGLFRFGTATRGAMFVGRFFEDNFSFVKRIWNKLLETIGFKSSNFDLIVGEDDDRIRKWLEASLTVLAPVNKEKVLTRPEWSQKVFELVIVGKSLQIISANEKCTSPKLLQLISQNLTQLLKLEKELIDGKMFSGVRYEPFSLWLSGSAGCGKTRLSQVCAQKFAEKVNYPGAINYHTITAGQKYFDGFHGQPTVILDDFLSMSVATDAEQYSQFLQMKSSALFNPPFAVAEDKIRLVNFQNLIITSNQSHFSNLAGISNTEAYNRRRDLVLDFKFRKEGVDASNLFDNYSLLEIKELAHVDVYICNNPLVENASKELIKREEGKTYLETVLRLIDSRHAQYHAREMSNYQEASKKLREFISSHSGSDLSLEEHLKKYKEELSKYQNSPLATDARFFEDYISKSQEATLDVKPQGPNPEAWPIKQSSDLPFTDLTKVPEGKIIHPLERDGYPAYEQVEKRCLHQTFDFDFVYYDKETQIYFSPSTVGVSKHIAYSVSHCPCKIRKGKELIDYPDCSILKQEGKHKFYHKILFSKMLKSETLVNFELGKLHNDWSHFEEEFHEDLVNYIRVSSEDAGPSRSAKIATATYEREASIIKSKFKKIANAVIPIKSRFKSFCQSVWTGLLKLLEFVTHLLLIVMVAATAIMTIILSVWFWKHKDDEDLGKEIHYHRGVKGLEGQLHPSGDFKSIRNPKSIQTRALKLVGENDGLETCQDPVKACRYGDAENFNGVLNKITGNVFFLCGKIPIEGSSDMYRIYKARCLGLYNRKFLILKHYVEHFRSVGVTKVVAVFKDGLAAFEFDFDNLKYEWTEGGYGVSELPVNSPKMFKDIVRQMPRDNFNGVYPGEAQLIEVFSDHVTTHNVEISLRDIPTIVPATSTQSSWVMNHCFEYSWGGSGKCGTLVFMPKMASPLVGIHVAGVGNKRGFAELLFRDTFLKTPELSFEFVEPQMSVGDNVYGLDGDYSIEGQLPAKKVPGVNPNSRIIPSEIQQVFPVRTEPAPLTAYDKRLSEQIDIFRIGVSKRCKHPKHFPEGTVHSAVVDIARKLDSVLVPQRAKLEPLTIVEAVEGFELPNYEAMEMRTSEGYPWVLQRPKGCKDKSWLFEFSSQPGERIKIKGFNKGLLNTLRNNEDNRKNCNIPSTYFTACLKDARILCEKVEIPGKTRIFEISPVDLTIAQRQYFLDFTAAYRSAGLKAEHTIGINPDGIEWTNLANRLTEFSPFILTADFSGYGPGLNQLVLMKAFDISIEWLDNVEVGDDDIKEDRYRIRNSLKYEIVKGLHIAKDLVFRPTSGMPSGNCETVERNSMCNSIYWRIAFLELAKKFQKQYCDLYWFDKKVLLFHNGDDVIASVKEDIISWFNNETVIEFFGQYEIKMTDALKSGKIRPYCSIEEATYLKRGFKPHPTRKGHWLAPLETSSVTDTANWIWRCMNEREASLLNSEQACRLAYGHGPEFYSYVCKTISKAWKKKKINFKFPKWETLDCHVWDGTEGPIFSF